MSGICAKRDNKGNGNKINCAKSFKCNHIRLHMFARAEEEDEEEVEKII